MTQLVASLLSTGLLCVPMCPTIVHLVLEEGNVILYAGGEALHVQLVGQWQKRPEDGTPGDQHPSPVQTSQGVRVVGWYFVYQSVSV